ncbi:hypothetical protein QBC37DRAFT_29156 [Rhypophila decipiens]|uniref:Uncharacterized protein n=1 Tax=Rhypophila decipiens TaxID=261697 RepID=A0AAN6Y236_9PEZI|nr:hypothetical protein QBC37DRAFT_29156 [Rhypophila decipiens]
MGTKCVQDDRVLTHHTALAGYWRANRWSVFATGGGTNRHQCNTRTCACPIASHPKHCHWAPNPGASDGMEDFRRDPMRALRLLASANVAQSTKEFSAFIADTRGVRLITPGEGVGQDFTNRETFPPHPHDLPSAQLLLPPPAYSHLVTARSLDDDDVDGNTPIFLLSNGVGSHEECEIGWSPGSGFRLSSGSAFPSPATPQKPACGRSKARPPSRLINYNDAGRQKLPTLFGKVLNLS